MSDDGAQAGHYQGRTVGGGRYQLRDLLGAGGMASVHLAYDSVLDRQVAVKTLHTELGREPSFRERFRREAQSVAKLTHTNIVSVFDSGEDEIDGALVPYIVMEYIEGKPLRTVLDEDVAQFGAMPADKALKIVADVLAALEVSHEMGLVHRDIKPGNVMLNRRGVVKVMDFGIARAMQSGVTSMTQTGMVVGTPQYLSPEQALGRGVDARSDLYSVGIMLFELITGRLPFDADSPLAIAYAHVQEEPPVPSSINRSLPPAVDALVARALKKNPNERFPTAEAMREECERVRNAVLASNTTPLIVGGGPAHSGSAVSQTVFPPVDATGTPPPPGVQQPYQHYAQSGFGASTPPPAPAYSTPAPGPYGHQGGGPSTPPPYGPSSSSGHGGGHGGGRRNTGVLVGSAIAAIIAVSAVIIAVALNNGDDKGGNRADGSPTPVQSTEQPAGTGGDTGGTGGDTGGTGTSGGQSTDDTGTGTDTSAGTDDNAGFKDEDKSKTIDVTKCTEASDSFLEDGKKSMPDLTFKHLDSVKECVRQAGWVLEDVQYEDENLYGKNTVLEQSPKPYEAFDPEEDKITLTVSTGNPAP